MSNKCPRCADQGIETIGEIKSSNSERAYYECPKCGHGWCWKNPDLERINFFIREEPYGFLSNFERTPFQVDNIEYPTNEHFYQCMKANIKSIHDYILNAPHARIAMVLGRQLEHNKHLERYMKRNWKYIKLRVMLKGLRAKFRNRTLRKMLLETRDAILHEKNEEDPFWGIGEGNGASWLGKLLMVVRDEKERGWVCSDFGYVRCAGDPNENRHTHCPDNMRDICFEIAEYETIHEP
jgi:ribA/ribD-fused uncharacterized protein